MASAWISHFARSRGKSFHAASSPITNCSGAIRADTCFAGSAAPSFRMGRAARSVVLRRVVRCRVLGLSESGERGSGAGKSRGADTSRLGGFGGEFAAIDGRDCGREICFVDRASNAIEPVGPGPRFRGDGDHDYVANAECDPVDEIEHGIKRWRFRWK